MPDRTGGHVDRVAVLDVEGTNAALPAEIREVVRVARVVAADHHHEVERRGQQLQHCVLPLLGGGADGVEGAEVLATAASP